MNYSEHRRHTEEKREYWTAFAHKVLADPQATIYECKTAAIGVNRFDKKLEEKLVAKGGRKLKF